MPKYNLWLQFHVETYPTNKMITVRFVLPRSYSLIKTEQNSKIVIRSNSASVKLKYIFQKKTQWQNVQNHESKVKIFTEIGSLFTPTFSAGKPNSTHEYILLGLKIAASCRNYPATKMGTARSTFSRSYSLVIRKNSVPVKKKNTQWQNVQNQEPKIKIFREWKFIYAPIFSWKN